MWEFTLTIVGEFRQPGTFPKSHSELLLSLLPMASYHTPSFLEVHSFESWKRWFGAAWVENPSRRGETEPSWLVTTAISYQSPLLSFALAQPKRGWHHMVALMRPIQYTSFCCWPPEVGCSSVMCFNQWNEVGVKPVTTNRKLWIHWDWPPSLPISDNVKRYLHGGSSFMPVPGEPGWICGMNRKDAFFTLSH